MFQKNQWMGGRPAGRPRLGQEMLMSTQAIVVRPAPAFTYARPTVYADFFNSSLQPLNNPQAPPCEPGSPGCIL